MFTYAEPKRKRSAVVEHVGLQAFFYNRTVNRKNRQAAVHFVFPLVPGAAVTKPPPPVIFCQVVQGSESYLRD